MESSEGSIHNFYLSPFSKVFFFCIIIIIIIVMPLYIYRCFFLYTRKSSLLSMCEILQGLYFSTSPPHHSVTISSVCSDVFRGLTSHKVPDMMELQKTHRFFNNLIVKWLVAVYNSTVKSQRRKTKKWSVNAFEIWRGETWEKAALQVAAQTPSSQLPMSSECA